MDDLKFGTRNKRGDWAPNQPVDLIVVEHVTQLQGVEVFVG